MTSNANSSANSSRPTTLEVLAFALAAAGMVITYIAISSVGDVSRWMAAGFYMAVVSVALLVIGRGERDRWTLPVRAIAGVALLATGAVTALGVAMCGSGILALAPCQG